MKTADEIKAQIARIKTERDRLMITGEWNSVPFKRNCVKSSIAALEWVLGEFPPPPVEVVQ